MSEPKLICLLGVSGSGKSTIANRLERLYGYVQARSYTTRPIRTECEGDEFTHTFITPSEVDKYRDDIVAHNRYNENEYFVTREMLKGCNIYVVDKEGLIQLKKNYHDKLIIPIYIKCDSSIASKRMADRGDSDEQILQRLQYDAEAFAGAEDICEFVVSNETNNGINDIVDYIDKTYHCYKGAKK